MALLRSASSSRSLSSLRCSDSSTDSSDSSSSSTSRIEAFCAALAASFSAILAFSVPFFFGGAAAVGLGAFSSSSDDASHSSWGERSTTNVDSNLTGNGDGDVRLLLHPHPLPPTSFSELRGQEQGRESPPHQSHLQHGEKVGK